MLRGSCPFYGVPPKIGSTQYTIHSLGVCSKPYAKYCSHRISTETQIQIVYYCVAMPNQ